jgi:hypothetical protein
MYNNGELAYAIWRDEMARAERAAELQRMLPPRERRHLPGILRRNRTAERHGC